MNAVHQSYTENAFRFFRHFDYKLCKTVKVRSTKALFNNVVVSIRILWQYDSNHHKLTNILCIICIRLLDYLFINLCDFRILNIQVRKPCMLIRSRINLESKLSGVFIEPTAM